MPAPPADYRHLPLELTRTSSGVSTAVCHALAWLVIGNSVGLYLALLLIYPDWQAGALTYGRWVPVHLNVQLYGWTSLPLVAWLIAVYEVDQSRVASWGPAAVWAWSAALVIGICHWLGAHTSGKIFLDWQSAGLWALMLAMMFLWCVLMASWQERSLQWSTARKKTTFIALLGLALVQATLAFAASPAVYPPIDCTTGGPTGSSLQGSALLVIGLMLLLPRVALDRRHNRKERGIWLFFGFSWLVFGVIETIGGTHHDVHQIASMLCLLPWIWLIPMDWARFVWPAGSRAWRLAMIGWWCLLVVNGLLVYQPGVLDRLKFTQALVAHSHLAMAGFTTSFCALLIVLLTKRRMSGAIPVAIWHLAVLVMILSLTISGWHEGKDPSWMLAQETWRAFGFIIRAQCGGLMLAVSLLWFWQHNKS